ncbi:MotE family protein [Falsiroseomonas sp. CW058]|uniref:MotE family protein n=1 Tax=Falsiroseomonas sp. CW058 TaxID=3388664 RepID=UPI003D3166C1
MPRPRLVPLVLAAALLLLLAKAERLFDAVPAQAQAQPQPAPPAAPPAPPAAPAAAAPAPAEAAAERSVLEALRARRAEIDAREQAAAAREVVVAAAERRLMQRVEELSAMQGRLEALERERASREEAGLRGLVRLYEGMRPRDAAAIFDDLDMPVLVRIVDRMREAKAAPVLGAMRPDRARQLTAELARLRAERPDPR